MRGLLELLVFIKDGPLPPGAAPSSPPLAQTRREQYNGSVDRMYMGTAGLSPLLTSRTSRGEKTVEWEYTKAPMPPALAKTYGGYVGPQRTRCWSILVSHVLSPTTLAHALLSDLLCPLSWLPATVPWVRSTRCSVPPTTCGHGGRSHGIGRACSSAWGRS